MKIETYSRDLLEPLVAFTNAQTASEPHIAPLTPERFISFVEKKTTFDPEGLFVAFEKDEIVGWVHAALAPGTERYHDPAVEIPRIRMLLYDPGRLSVGTTLLQEAIRWLRSRSEGAVDAMGAKYGYPFYRGLWMGGEPMAPVSLAHVHMAFEVEGYKNIQESIFMATTLNSPPAPVELPHRLEFVESPTPMLHEGMRESWRGLEPMSIRALVEGQDAGGIGWVLIREVAERLGAPVINIWTLGVREGFRRQGVATALCHRALSLGYAQGARFASVATQLGNAPAHATYARLGFRPYQILVGRERPSERSSR